jgi:cytochrome c-type biogenesis protein CcmH
MMLWFALALLTGAAIFAVLRPLARKRPEIREEASDADIYRARLDEIARDRARGLIGEAEAEAARTEAARKLLSASAGEVGATPATGTSALMRRRVAALVMLAGVPLVAIPTYLSIGSPELPGQPLASRLRADPRASEMNQLVARVEAHLAANPGDGRGFEVLAPVYLKAGRVEDAVRAYGEALRLLGRTPKRLADYGEAIVASEGGVVTARAKEAFEGALALDPANAKARFYAGIAYEQDGRTAQALTIFRAMLADGPADAPWRAAVEERVGRLAPGSDAGAAVAALPQAEQATAIRGMVEQLGERLRREGGDAEGWGRLVRSLMVLGERDKARAALADGLNALSDDAAKARLSVLAREAGVE